MEILQTISTLLTQVREQTPLVHQITNYVTVNDCANITLALGGSPVMADDLQEVEEMVSLASSLVLNIGTLNSRTIYSMIRAGQKANTMGIPVILDPVGVGATQLRTDTAQQIIREVKLAIIRGNLSEIKTLAGLETVTRGVDAGEAVGSDAEELAYDLAQQLHTVIAITGATDIISDGVRSCRITNGHPMLARVTGTGCMTTALIGTYSGVTPDAYLAAIAGILSMGIAGENAYADAQTPGSFRVRIFDEIATLTPTVFQQRGKIYEG